MGKAAVHFFIFLLLYLLLAGKASITEFIAGAAVALAAAAAAFWVRSNAGLSFRFKAGWVWILLRRLPWRAAADCGWVFLALWRYAVHREGIEGKFRIVPFDPGGEDAASAARRAIVLAAVSLTPNTLSISIDREKRQLLIHQLMETGKEPGGGDREWPL